MELHALFDGLAWISAALIALGLRRLFPNVFPPSPLAGDRLYILVVLAGASVGAYLIGSINLWLSGKTGIARSIEGALAGAIVAVELYKAIRHRPGRTAALYALPVAMGIAVGRVGCYLAGLDDFTYGTPTDLPWGHDFGDGVLRHPVQLYESGAMLVFALAYLVGLWRGQRFVIVNGFALVVLYYAVERFALEYWKPYPAVLFGLTVFQLLSICLSLYAVMMLARGRPVDAGRDH
jgi:phosphatidylglycerol---prolipoprotein diacylglyceryl transferase